MPKYKITSQCLKDPSHSQSYKAEEKFEEFIKPRKLLEGKGFQFPPNPLGIFQTIHSVVVRRGWVDFYQHPRDPMLHVVKEFYANMLRHDQRNIWVKNSLVPLDTRVINAYYNLPANIECEYSKLVANLTDKL